MRNKKGKNGNGTQKSHGVRSQIRNRRHKPNHQVSSNNIVSSVQGTERLSATMDQFTPLSDETAENPEDNYFAQDAAKQLKKVGAAGPTDEYTKEKERKRQEAILRNQKKAKCWPKFTTFVKEKMPSRRE